jgi:CelD/BcsL family acetyltransferase involved in cellulose biosynthesis
MLTLENIVEAAPLNKVGRMKTLDISIISNINGFKALQKDWQALAKTSDSSIYQTFVWNWIWWKHFGAGKQLHIIILRDGDLLVGIIPLFWDTISLLKKPLYSCLRFIGSRISQPCGETVLRKHPFSDYLDVIIRPGYQKRVIEKVIAYFEQAKLPFDEMVLDEVPQNSCLWEYLIPALRRKRYAYSVEESSVCPLIELGGAWNEYLQSLSKKSRYNNRKALRQIDKENKKGFHITEPKSSNEFDILFDRLVSLHQKRWNKQAILGTFTGPEIYNFNKDIAGTFYKKGWGQIRVAKPVKSPENAIALDLIFDYKDRIYLVHRTMDFSSRYSKAGPGSVLHTYTVKKAADSGKAVVDFLRGEHSYKFRTANAATANRFITIQNPSMQNTVRLKLACWYAMIKKRAKVEWAKYRLFMQGKTVEKGLSGYLKFLYERIMMKMPNKTRN